MKLYVDKLAYSQAHGFLTCPDDVIWESTRVTQFSGPIKIFHSDSGSLVVSTYLIGFTSF
jgi:hypothetical protein